MQIPFLRVFFGLYLFVENVIVPPEEVLGFGEIVFTIGGLNDKYFGSVCVFELPFFAMTFTTKFSPPTLGKVQLI